MSFVHAVLHDRGKRSGIFWLTVAVVLMSTLAPLSEAWTRSSWALMLTAPVVASLLVVWLTVPLPFVGSGAYPADELIEPEVDLVELAETLAIRSNRPTPDICVVRHNSPNVAVLPAGDARRCIVVTTGALESLNRQELEALCAMQWGLADDQWLRVLRQSTSMLLVAAAVGLALIRFYGSLGTDLGIFGLVGALCWWRLQWWTAVYADGLAVASTYNPEPLASALEKVACYNGLPLSPVRWPTLASTYWAVPLLLRSTQRYRFGRRVSSVERDIDIALLCRAGYIRKSMASGTTYPDWKRYRRALRDSDKHLSRNVGIRLGRFAVFSNGATRIGENARKRSFADDLEELPVVDH